MARHPDISVIVPTRDRSADLVRLIASLASCGSVGFPWELVVVDNDSSDDTSAVCRRASDTLSGASFSYAKETVPGLHAGRHRGAREAGGEVLVFVDDDVEVSPLWLPALRDAFADPDVELVGGPILPRYETDPPDWVESTWMKQPDGTRWCGYLSLLESGDHMHEIDCGFVWGLNFAIRRETLLRLRGFHPDALPWALRRYRGDGETGLALKAKADGVRAWFCPEALVYHTVPAHRLTEDYFARRSFLQGVSDSFTAVRAHRGPVAPRGVSLPDRLRTLVMRIRGARAVSGPRAPSTNLAVRLRIAYHEGYVFHQREVESDPALLAWVLRDDYMDGADPRAAAPRTA